MSRRQLTIKPSCVREIAAFPADRASLLWEKINQIVADPLPDGKVKKKLKGAEGVYRLRVADHRVFYRFGDDWVRQPLWPSWSDRGASWANLYAVVRGIAGVADSATSSEDEPATVADQVAIAGRRAAASGAQRRRQGRVPHSDSWGSTTSPAAGSR